MSPPSLRKLRNSKPTQDAIDDIQYNAEARALERKTLDGQQQTEEAVKSSLRFYGLLSLLGKVIRNAEAADGSIKESATRVYVRNQQQLINFVSKAVGDQEPKIRDVLSAAGEKDSAVADLAIYFVRILRPVALLKLAVREIEIGTIKLIETFRKNLAHLPADDEAHVLYGLLAFEISTQADLELLAPIVQASNNVTILRTIQIKVILAYLMNDCDLRRQAELESLIEEIEQRLGTAPVSLQTLKVRVAAQTISHVEGN
jgi:hypothetical protein